MARAWESNDCPGVPRNLQAAESRFVVSFPQRRGDVVSFPASCVGAKPWPTQ